ncbi:unnamed protein product [Pleuronectes platessa]|uniref:Secreted protein n=1 Tax=Pleuronectes platessa TaxID=8262 RepID=A0A9N7VS39_PLEPL|nr:unnamed protein product [Pleuronectes platessa]
MNQPPLLLLSRLLSPLLSSPLLSSLLLPSPLLSVFVEEADGRSEDTEEHRGETSQQRLSIIILIILSDSM